MDQMNEQKIKALEELIRQMQGVMAEGGGDEPMDESEVSEGIEEAMEESSEPSMEDSCKEEGEDSEDEMDPIEKMKQDFMRGKVDRPRRKSLMIIAKPTNASVSASFEKKMPEISKKKKGYK